MEMCVNWTIEGDKPLKKCPQVYELEDEIKHITALKNMSYKRIERVRDQLKLIQAENLAWQEISRGRDEWCKKLTETLEKIANESGLMPAEWFKKTARDALKCLDCAVKGCESRGLGGCTNDETAVRETVT